MSIGVKERVTWEIMTQSVSPQPITNQITHDIFVIQKKLNMASGKIFPHMCNGTTKMCVGIHRLEGQGIARCSHPLIEPEPLRRECVHVITNLMLSQTFSKKLFVIFFLVYLYRETHSSVITSASTS